MSERRRYRALPAGMVLALVLGMATGAGGQTPASAFRDLRRYFPGSPPSDATAAQVPAVPVGTSSLATLGSRVRPSVAISVLTADGQQIAGRFVAVSDESLTMNVGAVERTILAADVRQVVVAHGTNRTKLGIVVGGLFGAMIGQARCADAPSYANQEDRPCAPLVLVSTGVLAAIGGVIGATRWRPAVVLPSRLSPATVAPVDARAPAAAAAELITPGPRADLVPVQSLDLVNSRVKPFERIHVRTSNGREVSGAFRHASATQLQLERGDQTVTLAADEIQTVVLRGGTNGKRGMLYGLAVGAAIGAVVGATAERTAEWKAADNIAFGVLALGGAGLIYGGLGGLLVQQPNAGLRRRRASGRFSESASELIDGQTRPNRCCSGVSFGTGWRREEQRGLTARAWVSMREHPRSRVAANRSVTPRYGCCATRPHDPAVVG